MADITKVNEQICAWQKNLEKLKNGEFGKINSKAIYKTLLEYWKAQAKANYPYASENVKYYEELVRTNTKKTEGGG